jgi:hypothetical protein
MNMFSSGLIKKYVQRLSTTIFALLEVLGLPRIPRKGDKEEAKRGE